MNKVEKIVKEAVINEIFNKPLETEYEIKTNGHETTYTFKLSSGNEYFVRFISDDKIPSEALIDYSGDRIFYYMTIVGFSDIRNINTSSDKKFNRSTNNNEQVELIGKIIYILKEYEKSMDDEGFIFLTDNPKKVEIYRLIYRNNFNSYSEYKIDSKKIKDPKLNKNSVYAYIDESKY